MSPLRPYIVRSVLGLFRERNGVFWYIQCPRDWHRTRLIRFDDEWWWPRDRRSNIRDHWTVRCRFWRMRECHPFSRALAPISWEEWLEQVHWPDLMSLRRRILPICTRKRTKLKESRVRERGFQCSPYGLRILKMPRQYQNHRTLHIVFCRTLLFFLCSWWLSMGFRLHILVGPTEHDHSLLFMDSIVLCLFPLSRDLSPYFVIHILCHEKESQSDNQTKTLNTGR